MNLQNISTKVGAFIILLTFSMSTLQVSAAQTAGKVVFSFGKGYIKGKDQKLRPLKRGALLRSGDEVVTEKRTRTQIKMNDGSFFSLKPNTQFQVKSFVYKKDPKKDKSFFGLLKGGFRALTGLIGKHNKKAYGVSTPVATIGIRGTDYDVILVPPKGAAGGSGQLITHTNSGAISLTNSAGTQVFSAGQSAFVAGPKAAPRQATPQEAEKVLSSGHQKSKKEEKKDDKKQVAKKKASKKKAAKKKVAKQLAKVKKENDPTQGTENEGDKIERKGKAGDGDVSFTANTTEVSPDSFIYSPRTVSYAGADLETNGYASSIPSATVVTDKFGRVSAIEDGSNGHVKSVQGTVSNFGNNKATGISWGRWNAGEAKVIDSSGADFSPAKTIHWASGPKVVMPVTGTASYQVVGNTAPTDASGNSGVLGNVVLNADFSAQRISRVAVTAAVGNNAWNASQRNVPINMSTGGFNATNPTVRVNGTVGGSGEISGNFTGSGASGATMSYLLKNSAGTDNITGAIGLKKKQ